MWPMNRSGGQCKAVLGWISVACCLACSSPARAQHIDTLTVNFVVDDAQKALEAGTRRGLVADSMVAVFQEKFPFWPFRADTHTTIPSCRIVLLGESGDRLRLVLFDHSGQAIGPGWSCVFRDPGESGPFPNWKFKAPRMLATTLREKILTLQRDTLLSIMGANLPLVHLPVGLRALPDSIEVLPLPYERCFDVIGLSAFRLTCSKANGDVVTIHSKGRGRSGDYPGPPSFLGLVVSHLVWELDNQRDRFMNHATEYPSLHPCVVLLEHEVRNPLVDVAELAGPQGDGR